MSSTEVSDISMVRPNTVILQVIDPSGSLVDMNVDTKDICKASELIDGIMDDNDIDNDPIPLLEVTFDQIQLIFEFYAHYFAEPFDIPENKDEDMEKWFVLKKGNLVDNGFPAWAEKMLDDIPLTPEPIKDHGRFKGIFDLFKASQFMICNKLSSFISLKISSMITEKTSSQIRDLFAIENDFDDVDEFEMVEEEIPIKDPVTGEVKRTITRKYKKWIKITEETANVVNSVPA